MKKQVFLKTLITILTLCVACCALIACNEKPADTPEPTPTPTPEPEPPKFYEAKDGYEYGEDVDKEDKYVHSTVSNNRPKEFENFDRYE